MANQPWYMYTSDQPGGGYGEIIDPVCANGSCNYLKPDTNIAVPAGTPITSLLPGVVTDVSQRGTGNGGLSVTVKLDNALNSLAQYVSYNFLGSTSVYVGQKVQSGQTVGYAGSPTGINFALALGSSPSWGGAGFSENAKGNPLLDPRPLLKAAISNGTSNLTSQLSNYTGGGGGSSSSGACDIPLFGGIICSQWFEQGTFVLVGLLLALIALVIIALPDLKKVAEKAVP